LSSVLPRKGKGNGMGEGGSQKERKFSKNIRGSDQKERSDNVLVQAEKGKFRREGWGGRSTNAKGASMRRESLKVTAEEKIWGKEAFRKAEGSYERNSRMKKEKGGKR